MATIKGEKQPLNTLETNVDAEFLELSPKQNVPRPLNKTNNIDLEAHDSEDDLAADADGGDSESKAQYHRILDSECEPVEEYKEGGHHPVHLDDMINDRFEVVAKQRHTAFSTIWLVIDHQNKQWRSLQILMADYSTAEGPDVLLMDKLESRGLKRDTWEKAHIILPLEVVKVTGPNGEHVCYVLPVLGPSIGSSEEYDEAQIRETPTTDMANKKKVLHQVAEAIQYLHRRKLHHGNLTPQNIVLQLDNIDKLTKKEMLDIIGEPSRVVLRRKDGRHDVPTSPKYLVEPAEIWRLPLKHEIGVFNFDVSFDLSKKPNRAFLPARFEPPERYFECDKDGDHLGFDVWALACIMVDTLFEATICGGEDHWQYAENLEFFIGPFPGSYRALWLQLEESNHPDEYRMTLEDLRARCRHKKFDDESARDPLREIIDRDMGWYPNARQSLKDGSFDPSFISNKLTETEADLLDSLLCGMLRYDPDSRSDIDSVLGHKWFDVGPESNYIETVLDPNGKIEYEYEEDRHEDEDEPRLYQPLADPSHVEDIESYRKGGFHPVHIGDMIIDRFEVIAKLGAGGYATVWLCWDIKHDKWKAVKINMTAERLDDKAERDWQLKEYLEAEGATPEEIFTRGRLALPLEQFTLTGPNGTHHCYVLPFLGRRIHDIDFPGLRDHRGLIPEKRMLKQVAQGLQYMNLYGYSHGDLTSNNILRIASNVDKISKREMQTLLRDQFNKSYFVQDIVFLDGVKPGPFAPRQVYQSITLESLEMTDEIVIIDFGLSFKFSRRPSFAGTPPQFLAPEGAFCHTLYPESDIWSLATVIIDCLFFKSIGGAERKDYLKEIELYVGPVPEPFREMWMNEQVRKYNLEEEEHIEQYLELMRKRMPLESGELPPLSMSREEMFERIERRTKETNAPDPLYAILEQDMGYERDLRRDFYINRYSKYYNHIYHLSIKMDKDEIPVLYNLLRNMLEYDPEERLSVAEVLKHEWFQEKWLSNSAIIAPVWKKGDEPPLRWPDQDGEQPVDEREALGVKRVKQVTYKDIPLKNQVQKADVANDPVQQNNEISEEKAKPDASRSDREPKSEALNPEVLEVIEQEVVGSERIEPKAPSPRPNSKRSPRPQRATRIYFTPLQLVCGVLAISVLWVLVFATALIATQLQYSGGLTLPVLKERPGVVVIMLGSPPFKEPNKSVLIG